MEEEEKLNVIALGIIFDPKEKKILIGKREDDPHTKELIWCFPGGKLIPGDEIDSILKKHIKARTGYEIKNLGAIFSKSYPEEPGLLAVYFLTYKQKFIKGVTFTFIKTFQ